MSTQPICSVLVSAMNSTRFQELATAAFGAPEAFNSNNAWGFGGGIGLRWSDGKVVVKVFTAYYRHLKPSKVVTVTVSGQRVVDEIQNAKGFDYAAQKLRLPVA